MLGKLLTVFNKRQAPIVKVTLEELLGLMANNEELIPGKISEEDNFRFLEEDNEFQYFGKGKPEQRRHTANTVVKVHREGVRKELPRLKRINGWEFKNQTIEKLDWNQLKAALNAKGISSWAFDMEHHFHIENSYIDYRLVLKVISEKVVVKTIELEKRFEKELL